jgi:hypothetical protein
MEMAAEDGDYGEEDEGEDAGEDAEDMDEEEQQLL